MPYKLEILTGIFMIGMSFAAIKLVQFISKQNKEKEGKE